MHFLNRTFEALPNLSPVCPLHPLFLLTGLGNRPRNPYFLRRPPCEPAHIIPAMPSLVSAVFAHGELSSHSFPVLDVVVSGCRANTPSSSHFLQEGPHRHIPVGADHSSVLGEQKALREEQVEEGTGWRGVG